MHDAPSVTVVMPVRNEEDFIARSLGAVLHQDYPAERLEVIVVDGASSDRTRELAESAIARHGFRSRARILVNPKRVVPSSLNLALASASGAVVIRVDGHCEIEPDYVRRCVALLEETGADCVGGVIRNVGQTRRAKAIALAQASLFGVGGAAFRTRREGSGTVDTVAFGAYRREVFDRIGLFDEELVRNQDDELNFRLVQSGGRIWLDPSLETRYYSRSTFSSLWRQYYGYGFYKVRVIAKRRAVAAWRHLVPAAFVAGLVGSGALGWAAKDARFPLSVSGPYLAAVLAASAAASRRHWTAFPLVPPSFLTLHLAYGLGFWRGIFEWAVMRTRAS